MKKMYGNLKIDIINTSIQNEEKAKKKKYYFNKRGVF